MPREPLERERLRALISPRNLVEFWDECRAQLRVPGLRVRDNPAGWRSRAHKDLGSLSRGSDDGAGPSGPDLMVAGLGAWNDEHPRSIVSLQLWFASPRKRGEAR